MMVLLWLGDHTMQRKLFWAQSLVEVACGGLFALFGDSWRSVGYSMPALLVVLGLLSRRPEMLKNFYFLVNGGRFGRILVVLGGLGGFTGWVDLLIGTGRRGCGSPVRGLKRGFGRVALIP